MREARDDLSGSLFSGSEVPLKVADAKRLVLAQVITDWGLVQMGGGYAVSLRNTSTGASWWLRSARVDEVRVFRSSDGALSVLADLGFDVSEVGVFRMPPNNKKIGQGRAKRDEVKP